jgi:cytochrome c oxidase subunit 1
VLATPVIAIALVLVVLERLTGIGVFDPTKGGDPLLFQHLFWFYSHPAVYVMILPGMGVMSEVVACFCRKRVFGYTAVAFSSVAIAVFSFFVWAHHMFIMGISTYSALVFSLMTMLVAVPSAIKIFNWSTTLYKESISFDTPMLYALGFIGLFTIGGLTGIFLASLGLDIHVTETYFVVAHFHYVMVGGIVSALMAGLHFWWPKITGRMYPEAMGRLAAIILFTGFNLTFFPQFHPGVSRDAAALLVLSSGVSGAERDVERRGLGTGNWIHSANPVLPLVAQIREDRRAQPMACTRSRMEHSVASPR